LDAAPLDVMVSEDGRLIYVLTDDAHLEVYSREGTLRGKVAVPPGSRRITGLHEEDALLITNPDERALQFVRLNLEFTFNTAQSPAKGPPNAPVQLVLFTDFECPYCAQLAPVLDQVHAKFPREVRIVFKNFPLRSHRYAAQAALAALAAADQGQFWPFHDRLFENFNQLNPEKIEEIRQALNLDAERFRTKMNDPALKQLIMQDVKEGNEAGVSGTPTVFINGQKYRGRRSLEGFQQAIEAALALAGEAAKK